MDRIANVNIDDMSTQPWQFIFIANKYLPPLEPLTAGIPLFCIVVQTNVNPT